MFQVVIAVLVIVLVARLILKGYRAEPVLFAAGLVLMVASQLAGWGVCCPKGSRAPGLPCSIRLR